MVHFLGLALLLFAAHALWSGSEREEIVVDRATAEFLIKQQSELLLRPLTKEEEHEIIEGFIEDEILFREAKKKGFDSSSRIRKLMIQNMRFFLASEIPEPSEVDLRAFYNQEQARFERPPAISLEHVYFADPKTAPETTLATLRNGGDPANVGDADFKIGKRVSEANQRQLVQIFGSENARKILSIKDDDWHGPMTSLLGAHFIKITARKPAHIPPFKEARRWIEAEWLRSKQRELIEAELKRVRPDYRIKVEDLGSGPDG